MENKASLVALSMWFSTHQFYQAHQALIHHSNAVRGQNHCMQATKQLFKLLQGKSTIDKNVGTLKNSSSDTTTKGKTQPSKMWANSSPQMTMKPQHPILNATAGEIAQAENGERTTPNYA